MMALLAFVATPPFTFQPPDSWKVLPLPPDHRWNGEQRIAIFQLPSGGEVTVNYLGGEQRGGDMDYTVAGLGGLACEVAADNCERFVRDCPSGADLVGSPSRRFARATATAGSHTIDTSVWKATEGDTISYLFVTLATSTTVYSKDRVELTRFLHTVRTVGHDKQKKK
jgi:hypothetical protein